MTQRPWTEVVDDPAARHLVAVRLAPGAAEEPAALLASLIEGLDPDGDFALLTRCGEECAVMLCAFTHPTDAQVLSLTLEAEEIDEYPEWGSCRGFTLDKAAAQGIADALEATVAPAPAPPMAFRSAAWRSGPRSPSCAI